MAIIERVTFTSASDQIFFGRDEFELPGLTIGIRSTTASDSDYQALNLQEVLTSPLDLIITDGTCS